MKSCFTTETQRAQSFFMLTAPQAQLTIKVFLCALCVSVVKMFFCFLLIAWKAQGIPSSRLQTTAGCSPACDLETRSGLQYIAGR